MKKIEKIKVQIIFNFIDSCILALVISFMIFFLFVVSLEHIWYKKYSELTDWYNSSLTGQLVIVLTFTMIFSIITFWLFMQRMNPITEAINKLSVGIGEIANGKFESKIEINQKNELGCLADDINIMSDKLKAFVEKEKQWNQERYHMITNVSHDLKTPMVSIMGYVEFIADKKYTSDEELTLFCNIVKGKTKELNQNVNQLFQLAQISSYDYKITKQKMFLREFTEQILLEYIPQLEENNMVYRIHISPDYTVMADIDSLKRVYENLINNTIKYAAEGRYLDIEALSVSDKSKIIFRNYGKKIEENECLQIFEKFYRQKNNSGKEGSGCGLYIVKRIVEMHGGEISVNSTDEYTDFIVILP